MREKCDKHIGFHWSLVVVVFQQERNTWQPTYQGNYHNCHENLHLAYCGNHGLRVTETRHKPNISYTEGLITWQPSWRRFIHIIIFNNCKNADQFKQESDNCLYRINIRSLSRLHSLRNFLAGHKITAPAENIRSEESRYRERILIGNKCLSLSCWFGWKVSDIKTMNTSNKGL